MPEIENLSTLSRLLLHSARSLASCFGGKSCFRKFVRRNRGKAYQVRTSRGFLFSGVIGDSVDNRIAIDLDYEPALSDFIAREALGAKAFLDIGCNVGWFSCLVASLAEGPQWIISIDANPQMVEACDRNLSLNGHQSESLVRAVGPKAGSINLHIPESRHSRASVGKANAASFGETHIIQVEMSCLGDLLERFPDGRCDLIKMDIEGYELETLRHTPADIISRVGIIILEYSRSNLKGCGFNDMTLSALPWLEGFTVQSLDEQGNLEDVVNPDAFSPKETTIVLRNRAWQ